MFRGLPETAVFRRTVFVPLEWHAFGMACFHGPHFAWLSCTARAHVYVVTLPCPELWGAGGAAGGYVQR